MEDATSQLDIPPPAPIEEPDERKLALKAAGVLVVLVALMAVVYFSPLGKYLTHVTEMGQKIHQMGRMAPGVSVLGCAALVAAGFPRLFLCPIGGMIFGFWLGLLWTQLGTALGYYLVFLFVRWGGREYVERRKPNLLGLADLIKRQGIPAVILARQLPIHGAVVNVVLGLTPLRHRHFLIGTAIGLFPEAIPCTLIGKGAVQGSFAKSIAYVAPAAVVLAAVWIGFGLYAAAQSRNGKRQAASLAESPPGQRGTL